MRVLVACEYSGIVRDAFTAQGHYAMSADLLPTESPGPHHQGDVLDVLYDGWDLMVGHPPCTTFTNAANRWLYEDSSKGTAEERRQDREEAIEFFLKLWNAPIERIALENPQPHPYVIDRVGMYHDKLQPWMFGEPETKGICLWLKNLPPLMSTVIETDRQPKVHHMSPGEERSKERSRFFPLVAQEMAIQWG